jgi:hypothetical protein
MLQGWGIGLETEDKIRCLEAKLDPYTIQHKYHHPLLHLDIGSFHRSSQPI